MVIQVFVAAALMEYFITKDKTVAYRIFDLGLKHFGDEPNYVLAFLDHLSHLTGKNERAGFLKCTRYTIQVGEKD